MKLIIRGFSIRHGLQAFDRLLWVIQYADEKIYKKMEIYCIVVKLYLTTFTIQ